ncbi:MAG: hypothetical protein ACJARF_001534 [Alteromonadaceae bacterium]|jgi:hypothetical protein
MELKEVIEWALFRCMPRYEIRWPKNTQRMCLKHAYPSLRSLFHTHPQGEYVCIGLA